MSSRLANRRIRLLLAVLAFAFAITFVRAFWLQIVRAPQLERLAAQQHRETITTPAGRGTIYDRTGSPLAIGEEATTVYADPRQVRNAHLAAVEAGRALALDPNKIYPQLLDKKRSFVYVDRKADPERAAALERRGLAGIDFYPEERRSYPQHTVASQVLGYAGVDNTGIAGLELGLERYLAGTPGKETIVRDPFGRTIDVLSSTPERPGRDVFLTLDHTLQAKVESVLRSTVEKWHAADGHGRRPRSADRRRAGDGQRPRLRRQQLRECAQQPSAEPGGHRHVRAGLDLQGRDLRGRPDRQGRHPEHDVHAPAVDPCRRPDDQ